MQRSFNASNYLFDKFDDFQDYIFKKMTGFWNVLTKWYCQNVRKSHFLTSRNCFL